MALIFKKFRLRRALLVISAVIVIALAVLPVGLTLAFRLIPVPATPLMVIRAFEGHGWSKDWVSMDQISPNLQRAAIASEDAKFCRHWGFDVEAIQDAWESNAKGGRVRGASTISQQTAKNLFLWPDRSMTRKGIEALFTLYLETLWPKHRILEVYLNIAEMGPGIYGAEAAAKHYFGKPAAKLTPREAALIVSALPNPRQRNPAQPNASMSTKARIIMGRTNHVALKECGL